MARRVIGICPHCGGSVREKDNGWFCQNRSCRFALWKDNHFFKAIGKHLNAEMAQQLLRDRQIRCKECVSKRTGKAFDAKVILTTEPDGKAHFDLDFIRKGKPDGKV